MRCADEGAFRGSLPVIYAHRIPIMTLFRIGLLAAVTSLSSCSSIHIVTTAPEPEEFKLSAEALTQKYHAMRKTEDGRLYAQEILTTRDEAGQKTFLASGGALLVKEAEPPILALAPSISITPEYAEARGKATVKRSDRLWIGKDDSTKIRIEGTEISLEGPVIIRAVAAADDPPEKPETEKAEEAAPAKEKNKEDAPKAAPSPPAPEPAKEKPAAAAKPSSPPPAPKPKAAPAVDRARVLNLMREPTER